MLPKMKRILLQSVPKPRRGFSLIELTVALAMISMLALSASEYFAEDTKSVLISRAKSELKSLQSQVQASAMKARNYHFSSLAEALGKDEPPQDPWGHPYLLLHGGFQSSYTPEADYWVTGASDALFSANPQSESGETLLTHYIISAGPHEAYRQGGLPGQYDAQLDDLRVPVKLGVPGGKAAAPQQASRFVLTQNSVLLRIYDCGSMDGDAVSVTLNAGAILTNQRLSAYPGSVTPLTLPSGENTLKIKAHNLGTSNPNTVGLEIVVAGEIAVSQTWGLSKDEEVQVTFEAP